MNFIKTHIRWIVYPLVILALPGAWLANFYIQANAAKEPERLEEAAQNEIWTKIQAYGDAYDAREKADTYGGTTPQETWGLFVKALEAGDTDLASKYFVQKKQEEMKRDLAKGKANGVLPGLLDDFKTIQEGRMHPGGEYFTYLTKPTKVDGIPGIESLPFTYELEKSRVSGLWKITDL